MQFVLGHVIQLKRKLESVIMKNLQIIKTAVIGLSLGTLLIGSGIAEASTYKKPAPAVTKTSYTAPVKPATTVTTLKGFFTVDSTPQQSYDKYEQENSIYTVTAVKSVGNLHAWETVKVKLKGFSDVGDVLAITSTDPNFKVSTGEKFIMWDTQLTPNKIQSLK